jgi:hypothetical protein
MLPASAVLLSESASRALAALEAASSSNARAVARRARALKPILLMDCLHGEVVKGSALPRGLRVKYDLSNLFVEDLPDFWRLLYTVVKQDARRVVVVVEIVSHRDYSRWFPGRGR